MAASITFPVSSGKVDFTSDMGMIRWDISAFEAVSSQALITNLANLMQCVLNSQEKVQSFVYAALFQEYPLTVASLLTSSNPILLGRYLKACFSHRQLALEHGSISV